MGRPSPKPAAPRMRVGTIVGMPDDLGIVTRAEVVEDRGYIAIDGGQMVVVRYQIDGCDEDFETELPVSDLVEPPTVDIGEQFWRRLAPEWAKMRQARRAASA